MARGKKAPKKDGVPSAAAVRKSIIARVRTIESHHALLAIDGVVTGIQALTRLTEDRKEETSDEPS